MGDDRVEEVGCSLLGMSAFAGVGVVAAEVEVVVPVREASDPFDELRVGEDRRELAGEPQGGDVLLVSRPGDGRAGLSPRQFGHARSTPRLTVVEVTLGPLSQHAEPPAKLDRHQAHEFR